MFLVIFIKFINTDLLFTISNKLHNILYFIKYIKSSYVQFLLSNFFKQTHNIRENIRHLFKYK